MTDSPPDPAALREMLANYRSREGYTQFFADCMANFIPSIADALERLAVRPCTCHPDDNPPTPCPRRYALQDCRAAANQGSNND